MGQTVEEWFKLYSQERENLSSSPNPRALNEVTNAALAFMAMGTNAVPYLADKINQHQELTRLTLLRLRYRQIVPGFLDALLPKIPSKVGQGMDAANILAVYIKPPGEMLIPLVDSALRGTNSAQRSMALLAIRGISSGYVLAQQHLSAGLNDTNGQIQKLSAMAIRWHGSNGKWAVSNLAVAARTSDLEALRYVCQALCELNTNALPIVPDLRQMLTLETNEDRRLIIGNAIDYISH